MDKVIVLMLCKDFCEYVPQHVEQITKLGFKNIIICNCSSGRPLANLSDEVTSSKEIQIAGVDVFNHQFVDYSHARNALFDYADKLYKEQKVYLINDDRDKLEISDIRLFERTVNHMLTKRVQSSLSINMRWWDPRHDPEQPNKMYFIKQKTMNGDRATSWYLPKLVVSHQRSFRYYGYAHEYLDGTRGEVLDGIEQFQQVATQEQWNAISAERIPLLEKQLGELQADKKSQLYARTLFYLGREYTSVSNEKAYEMLSQRANLDGFMEEKFEATKLCAELASNLLGKSSEGLTKEVVCEWFEKALKLQKRAEIYVAYAKYLLGKNRLPEIGNHHHKDSNSRDEDISKAHELVQQCMKLKPPASNVLLFVDETSYGDDRQKLYMELFPPKYERPSMCEVCFESTEVQRLLPCSHWLCSGCVAKTTSQSCPFCRQPITAVG